MLSFLLYDVFVWHASQIPSYVASPSPIEFWPVLLKNFIVFDMVDPQINSLATTSQVLMSGAFTVPRTSLPYAIAYVELPSVSHDLSIVPSMTRSVPVLSLILYV